MKVFHVYFTTAKSCQCLILLISGNYCFMKKIHTCDNSIVRSLYIMSKYEYGKIMLKYSIHNPGSDAAELKSSLWRHFVDTVF